LITPRQKPVVWKIGQNCGKEEKERCSVENRGASVMNRKGEKVFTRQPYTVRSEGKGTQREVRGGRFAAERKNSRFRESDSWRERERLPLKKRGRIFTEIVLADVHGGPQG